jgi:Polyketide cyclase / dehydrase and lipid transport
MPIFKLTQVIDRPVAEVFDTVIHLEKFPEWSPQNPSARRVGDGEIGEGSRFEMEIKGFGLVPQTLEEFDRNRQVRVVPHIKQIQGGHRFIFADLDGRTRIDHEMEMTPKGAYVLMLPMMYLIGRRNLKLTVEALKRFLEARR